MVPPPLASIHPRHSSHSSCLTSPSGSQIRLATAPSTPRGQLLCLNSCHIFNASFPRKLQRSQHFGPLPGPGSFFGRLSPSVVDNPLAPCPLGRPYSARKVKAAAAIQPRGRPTEQDVAPGSKVSSRGEANHSLDSTEEGTEGAEEEVAPSSVEKRSSVQQRMADVDADMVQQMAEEAATWCALRGLLMGDKRLEVSGEISGVGATHAPVALLPSPFPCRLFSQANELAPLFNQLVDDVSQDAEFLQETLKSAGASDPFTGSLLRIHAEVLKEGVEEPLRLGLHRSDYMVDTSTGRLLQIELNTISSAFAGLSTLATGLHRHMLCLFKPRQNLDQFSIPRNEACEKVAAALLAAWREAGDESAAILTVVKGDEPNQYDQRWLAHSLQRQHRDHLRQQQQQQEEEEAEMEGDKAEGKKSIWSCGVWFTGVKILRKTLAEIESAAELGPDRSLLIDGVRVSVVYFRTGYDPADYPTQKEWDARLLIERSSAVKCPTIAYHLAGTKKVQQQLAQPGVLERFVSDPSVANQLRASFAGLWSLQGEGANAIIQEAIEKPNQFVLKPQREGGGNNFYAEEMVQLLLQLKRTSDFSDERGAFILMQRIFPPLQESVLMRNGEPRAEQAVSELGVYGCYLRRDTRVIINEYAGYLLRTKTSSSDEGGVASGYAVLDTPFLE